MYNGHNPEYAKIFMIRFEKQYILSSKINQYYNYDIPITYSWHGQELSKNYSYF